MPITVDLILETALFSLGLSHWKRFWLVRTAYTCECISIHLHVYAVLGHSWTTLNVIMACQWAMIISISQDCTKYELKPAVRWQILADTPPSPNTIQNNTMQYNTIQYNIIQYNTIQYNTIQYNTIQYNRKPMRRVEVECGLVIGCDLPGVGKVRPTLLYCRPCNRTLWIVIACIYLHTGLSHLFWDK